MQPMRSHIMEWRVGREGMNFLKNYVLISSKNLNLFNYKDNTLSSDSDPSFQKRQLQGSDSHPMFSIFWASTPNISKPNPEPANNLDLPTLLWTCQ
jgi:hypothetical protein